MLKREHLKQAIDAIARWAPEIGYTVDELFAVGEIDTLPASRAVSDRGDYLFKFLDQTPIVRRFSFFHEGTAPIEQQMLIHCGSLLKKQSLVECGGPARFLQAAEQTLHAGFDSAVAYEIGRTLAAFDSPRSSGSATGGSVQASLHRLQAECCGFHDPVPKALLNDPAAIRFDGMLGNNRAALFSEFPLCRQALVQLAELNLEFFHLRKVFDIMLRAPAGKLFACLVEGCVAGLVWLVPGNRRNRRVLEIRYIASARDRLPGLPLQPLRGVGSFLVAGSWFYWKYYAPGCRALVLDSEIGAMKFYSAIGFEQHRRYVYQLSNPRGHLLDSLVRMAECRSDLNSDVLAELAGYLRRQIRRMAASPAQVEDKTLLKAIRHSLVSHRHELLARTAAEELLRQSNRIDQAQELLRIGTEIGRLRFKTSRSEVGHRILILNHPIFREHLKSVFHMESTRRLEAVQAALDHPTLADRWISVDPRAATPVELGWVHSPGHIAAIAATAGRAIHSLDLDTQTTARSYETACLAAGGIFALLDAVWAGAACRAFAFVRPPGHHAEPGRAMGFCLFNNIALAAHYLSRIYGLERIMIVDIDAHHGNGTQKAFYDNPAVLFASLHQYPGFPGSGHLNEVGTAAGEGYTVNIPLPGGSRDTDFAQAVYSIVRPIAQQYEPEVLLVSCGFDLYQHDRLANMHGTPEGYALMTFFLKEIADQLCGGRLVFVLEGGYHLVGIEACARRTLQELIGPTTLRSELIARIRSSDPCKSPPLHKVIEIQKQYWDFS